MKLLTINGVQSIVIGHAFVMEEHVADKQSQQKQLNISRRGFLSAAAIGVGLVASVSFVSKLLPRSQKSDPGATPLPGEGSIFQPRQDAHYKEWVRNHPQ